jgi:hypothetical protein
VNVVYSPLWAKGNNMNATAVLILGDKTWNEKALHLACALAKNHQLDLVLATATPVIHPQMLGTDAGYILLPTEQRVMLRDMSTVAMEYNLPVITMHCQYASWVSGLKSIAEQLGAAAFFVQPPVSSMAFWSTWQTAWLRRQLYKQKCQLITLDENGDLSDWVTSVTFAQ